MCDGYLPAVAPKTKRTTGNADCALGWSGSQPLSRRALALAVRQLNIVGPVSRVLAGPHLPQDAVTCFDFFRFRVGTSLNASSSGSGGGNPGFWDRTLLQTAHAEPAVWNAVAALGALHRRWEVVSRTTPLPVGDSGGRAGVVPELDSVSVKLTERAGICYTKALSLASSIHEASRMLVLSIALAVAASLAGKWSDNQIHIRAGRNLISQIVAQVKNKPVQELEINDAVECLAKLYMQWASFSEQRAPFPYTDGLRAEWTTAEAEEEQEIGSISKSLTVLLDINRRVLGQAGLDTSHKASLDTSKSDELESFNTVNNTGKGDPILRDFATWREQTLRVLATTATNNTAQLANPTFITLKLYHTFIYLLLSVGVARSDYNELSWDNHLGYFERIITLSVLYLQAHSQRNPFAPSVVSLDEPGVIMLLWLTVSRCRHPLIRRRGLGLLYSARRQEGPWLSTGAAAVTERFIVIEEEDTPDISMPILVPAFFSPELCTTFEVEHAKLIEAEDKDPQSWLLSGSGFGLARTNWEVPGMVLVPLHKRITEVSVTLEPYGPTSMVSCAEVTMIFAEKDATGEPRQHRISVRF